MEEYALYAAKNIFQIKKSQLEAKLDKNLQNAAKNYAMKTKMIDSEDINPNNREKDIEEEDKDNIYVPTADTYSHAVAIMHMR